ncbi:uncharacterized protein LOC106661888 [Cimex lectularius]|uniref:Peroxidase n=1 Tax=Cimex lectularius TaxID=79782 RepID=A0A8I6TBK8_CIMLE|nr:uncharacterized protein LOC106661888 [Cimex lectularius]
MAPPVVLLIWGLLITGGGSTQVPLEDLTAFVNQAHEAMSQRFHSFEPNLHNNGIRQEPGTPAWFMGASHTGKPSTKNITHAALMAEETTKYMSHALGLSASALVGHPVIGTELGQNCPAHEEPWCQAKKYRSLSGHCNNVQTPSWGSAGSSYARYLSPDYADDISLPRGTALYPEGLPSARDVSLGVHDQVDRQHSHLVATAAIWAQLVTNDLSLTPQMTGYNGVRLKCCGVEFADFHPECFPIRLPENDPIHGGARCQEYTRSATAPRKSCTLGPREQVNEATAFLDGSSLYGTSTEENEQLRTFEGGKLLLPNGLLPPSNSSDCRPSRNHRCFKSGDVRVNENIGLATIHTILAREHNRLAEQLSILNSHWVDEILFQEARRLLIAQLQYITYKEFLPLILGQDTMESYNLQPLDDGYFQGYDINQDPSIANAVASAALHFSVSLMPTSMKLFDLDGRVIGEDTLDKTFYAPFRLYSKNGVETIVQSLLRSPALDSQRHINSVFTQHMFQTPEQEGGGLDLIAQLIQQGRDHGIPGYTKWLKFCGMKEPSTFSELINVMPQESINALLNVYRNVSEIDLLSGGLSEYVPEGSTVGPTFRCLLAKQFLSIRSGDRHWMESEHSGFTRAQLKSLREGSSLARILCDNTAIKYVQPNAFLTIDPFLNSYMECGTDILGLNLAPWKEEKKQFIIPNKQISEAIEKAESDLLKLHKHEWMLHTQNLMADPQSPVGTAFGFNRPKRQAAKIANTSLLLEYASTRLIRSFIQGELQDLETRDINSLVSTLPQVELGITRETECLEMKLPCDHTSKYRTYSGWCNNLERPEYGQSFRPFARILPPVYADGIGAPRMFSVNGGTLPSPRLISTMIHTDKSRPHTRYTLMMMQFSQITDHDLTFTPVNKGFVGEGILNCQSCDSPQTVHPQCFPIEIPDGDPYFPSKGPNGERLCIPATRSMPGQETLGAREQMNQLTAYLDLSFVYGSDTCDASGLRSRSGGTLNVTRSPFGLRRKPLLPETPTNLECRSRNRVCFNAGDARASEQPALGSLHTVWLREHNRIARELSRINPHWDDERLYQETRRILGAVYQHIAFSEWLPRVVGRSVISKYGLQLNKDGYFRDYDPLCDVTIVNEFSAAAFRFGHSLLRPNFRRATPDYQTKDPAIRLRDHFFNPEVLYEPGIIDELILGLVDTPMETLDNFITTEVTEHLFENKSVPFSGMDLVSLNIQRGRDHGIHSYNDYREWCGLGRANSFNDLLSTTNSDLVEQLIRTYAHVDDVDLFPGGMSERPIHGGVVGPTFACIIAKQFSKIKRCDRFWYENDREFTRFTLAQLGEIRKIHLASLLCNNLDSVKSIQRNVFDLPHTFMNPRVPCKKIPQIDLAHWKDSASCSIKQINIDIGRTANISPCVSCTCTKEGPICQTVKVNNCISLLQNFSPDSVAADTSCKVQCLYVFKVVQEYTQSQNKVNLA